MQDVVCDQMRRFRETWWASDVSLPALGRTYDLREKQHRERHLERFLDTVSTEVQAVPLTEAERHAARERILSAGLELGRSALDFEQDQLRAFESYGFFRIAGEFSQMARRFDPTISGEDIYQAGRNVWSMNLLQLLLGLPVQLTPAVFAYSMLYPYSDNYLDDVTIPTPAKRAFDERFRQRLLGEQVNPKNGHEKTICDLIDLVEQQYERSRYPQVYGSLLAIHRAQYKSLRLLERGASPYEVDVLGLSFEKGGTAVLADGYLVSGNPSPNALAFMFGYGVFTQLMDDLEDVHQDLASGRLTIFSQTAGHWPLDAVTNRTFHLGAKVLDLMDFSDFSGLEPLRSLLGRSMKLLLIDSVGRAGRLYSKAYVRALEAHMPFRFSFLAKLQKRLTTDRAGLLRILEVFTEQE